MAAVAPKTDGGHNLGTADLRWGTVYTGNVNASGNVTISGNLSIIGNASEINVDNLSVAEPLIKLADGNTADTIDIGIYAQYNDGQDKYSVLYRDASDGKWKLATGLTEEPVPGSDIDLTGLATTTLVVDVLESNVLTGTDVNGDVTVTPNGTGHVLLVTDTVCLGEAGDAAVSLITPTDVDLVVRTGDPEADPADNSGSITINAGDNGDIDITPHGTGEVNISKVDIDSGTIDGATIATSDVTVGAGKTLDVSAGTLTLADDQISGDKVEGGTIASITVSQLSGAMDCNSQAMTNINVDSGNIDGATIATSDITVGAGKTLDVSAGTLTLADDQISGDKVEGGTIASITVSQLAGAMDCNSQAMTNINVDSGNIDGATIATSDITVGAGKELDVSAGTLTLADNQISGDKVEGGTIASITVSQLAGAMDCNSQAMTNVNIDSGNIDGATIATSDITVGAGKELDVSAGTLTLADNQISGDKVEGGTIASITVTALTSSTVGVDVLTASTINGFVANGAINFNSQAMTNVDINSGNIDGATIATSDITVGAGKELDVSAGTLTLADNQISGDKVEGGTIASITVSQLAGSMDCNSQAMTNVNIDSGNIDGATIATSDITVGLGKTLDVSAGTLTLADDQISGDKVSGGTIGSITVAQLAGAMDCNAQAMTNVNIDSGNIDGATIATSDITVGLGKTLDVSAGTLTLADNQISGDKVEGGTIASITVSQLAGAMDCNSQAMTNVNIDSGNIDGATIATSDITVGAGKTLDISNGTLTLANDQISGDKINGGIIGSVTVAQLAGAMDCNSQAMTNVNIDSGDIAGADVTVGAGKTLDVSAGTLTLADDQISGDKVEGGTIASITVSQLAGAMDCNSQAMTNVNIDSGNIDGATIATSDVTVGLGKTLDVSAGTLTLADNQISGDKVEGGTIASITVSQLAGAMDCNSQAMTNINVDSGNIDGATIATSDITVGAGKTLDVSAGTLTLADDQISGDKVEGGTIASITVSQLSGAMDCNSQAMTNINVDSGNIDGTAIGTNSRSSGKFTTLQANGNADFTSDVDISLDSGTAFRVGTTSNLLKSVFIVDTTDGSPQVTVAGDLIVNESITAGDTESGAIRIKGGLKYDVDAAKTTATTLSTSEHIVTSDSSSGNVSLSLPSASSNPGQEYLIVVIDNTNSTTLKPFTGEVIYDTDGTTLATTASPVTLGANRIYKIIAINSNWYRV